MAKASSVQICWLASGFIAHASERVSNSFFGRERVLMASRILNRRELRRQADHADEVEPDDSADGAEQVTKKRKAKVRSPPKARKPRPKKASPRLRARWGVFDG